MPRQVLLVFLGALLLYIASYWFIQNRRDRLGPWQVTFISDSSGVPSVIVAEKKLNLSDVRFTFPEARVSRLNISETLAFDRPKTNVPFGRVIFFDTTFLPGTLTFDFFGHQIELMPRALVIDRKEIPWQSGTHHELTAPPGPPAR